MPEVSVIIPTYSRPSYLERAINSVLCQSYKDLEIIVVDDNNDGDPNRKKTEAIMSQYASNESIRYIKHKYNMNGSAARNTGINHAKGRYIALLDDDDEWCPGKLHEQVRKLKTLPPEYGVVCGGIQYYSDITDKPVKQKIYDCHGDLYKLILKQNFVFLPAALVKKKCFIRAGLFDTSLESCQDWDMMIRISKSFHIFSIPKVHSIIHIHGDQISGKLNFRIRSRLKLFNKYFDSYTMYPEIYSHFLERLGVLYCLNNDPETGVDYFTQSVKINKHSFRTYIHLVLSRLFPLIHNLLIKKFGVTSMTGVHFYH